VVQHSVQMQHRGGRQPGLDTGGVELFQVERPEAAGLHVADGRQGAQPLVIATTDCAGLRGDDGINNAPAPATTVGKPVGHEGSRRAACPFGAASVPPARLGS
jgi:hypothetical protein